MWWAVPGGMGWLGRVHMQWGHCMVIGSWVGVSVECVFFSSVVAVGKVCMEADGACMAWGIVECEGSGWSCAVDVACGVMK